MRRRLELILIALYGPQKKLFQIISLNAFLLIIAQTGINKGGWNRKIVLCSLKPPHTTEE